MYDFDGLLMNGSQCGNCGEEYCPNFSDALDKSHYCSDECHTRIEDALSEFNKEILA